eukprot:3893949-Pyramimonas_sp.AAC.2
MRNEFCGLDALLVEIDGMRCLRVFRGPQTERTSAAGATILSILLFLSRCHGVKATILLETNAFSSCLACTEKKVASICTESTSPGGELTCTRL